MARKVARESAGWRLTPPGSGAWAAGTEGSQAGRSLVRWLGAGVAVGLVWRGLTPVAESQVDSYERMIAGQVILAVLAITAGLVVAARGLVRSGAGSAGRLLRAVAGSTAASIVAWGTGRLLGEPSVEMIAIPLLWPLTVSTVTVVVSLVTTLVSRDSY